MRTLKLLTVTAMVAAALTLAPAANAQTLPTVTVTAGRATTEGGAAMFTIALSEKVATDDIEVAFELEETERVGESVNSNLVLDTSEGSHTLKMRRGEDGADLVVRTIADGVHEDSEARNGRTNPLTLTIQPGPGYEVGTPSSATVQVGDDEAIWGTVGWEGTGVTVAEEDGYAELAVTLSKPYSYPVTVRTSGVADSASAGDDYDADATNGDVTIPTLSRRVTVRVGIFDDGQPENTETFSVVLAKNGEPVSVGDSVATITITDGDTAASLDAQDDRAEVHPGAASTDIDVLENDQYSGGDPAMLSITEVSDPANGQATATGDGMIRYTPDSGFDGTDTFTYTVSMGTLRDTATVEVVVPSNVDPSAAWSVYWSATTFAEGESVTMAIRNPDGTVDDSDLVAVTLHVGRTESTGDVDDIEVKEYTPTGQVLVVHPFSANIHHRGGWVFIRGFFPFGQAKTRTMTVEALDNIDGVDSETLATWVYVNGELAGSQVLTINRGPQTQR